MFGAHAGAQKTPLSFEAAAAAMRAALTHHLRWGPALPVLALALAKTAFETARWQSIWNHNWGNIKAGETYEGTYCCYPCNEVLASRVTWFIPEGELDKKGGTVVGKVWLVPPGHPQTRFRAYASAEDGARQYLEFVASGRYRDAWEILLLGDAVGYVHALKLKGYFTADEATYARGVVSLQDEFVRKLERLPASEVAVPDRDEVHVLVAPDPDATLRAEATAAATEAHFRDLEALRREAHAEMSGSDSETPPSEPRDIG